MAELTIRPDEIRDALAQFVEEYEPESASLEEVGTVVECGDGIARVEGLPSAMANELLEFEDGTRGLALNLDIREIGVVILGDFSQIEEGQQVRRTGEILSVPVGDSFLGRVVDPLGNPLDGMGEIGDTELRPLETQAPSVVQRQSVKEPLQTGIKAIDAMTAIGRGQRQLIIGDRQTGKTAIAIDTIINQRSNWESGDRELQVRCIYVAVGQRGASIASIRQSLEEAGALEYTTIVAAPASDPAGFKYIAPYTGSAIGQHWMYQGKHALIVFDDLSKQAEAYRAISLLLRRPPGREAYPGDVFYLHSRLLERCAKLSDDLGGGSLTGLPIVETKANDISAYIPTNVISITDGQIFLETELFNSGVRPAINVGRSVSRVGGAAQVRAMKKVAGTLRLALSQYRDLESFAAFASDLDAASRAQLDRGARLVELLKQPQYDPYPVELEVVSIWAGTNGYLDDVPVDDVPRFESDFLDSLKRNNAGILDSIRETKDLTDDTATALKDAIEQFRRTFEKSNGELLVADEDEPEAMGADEAGHEKVTRYTGPDGQSGDGPADASSPAGGGSDGSGASDVNGPSGGSSAAAAQPASGNSPGSEPGSGD
jgi:F-type H+/Na+-transporting ATPase subunit alpha